jgi:hypothetical protein
MSMSKTLYMNTKLFTKVFTEVKNTDCRFLSDKREVRRRKQYLDLRSDHNILAADIAGGTVEEHDQLFN